MDNKLCSKCGVIKQKKEFHKGNKYIDGLQCWCKKCSNANHIDYGWKHKEDWVRHFESKGILPKCEICGKELKFFNGRLGVNFDHKKEKLPIKSNPSLWLSLHRVSEENIKIWESCDFGVLCKDCNNWLPTKDRTHKMKGVLKYVFGKSLDPKL